MLGNEENNDKKTPNAADYLGDESPRARGEKKRRRALDWVYRWGYSSAEIIRQVVGQQAKGYAAGLVKKGWLTETKTESGTPRFFYTLTETGRQEVERFSENLLRYPEADPFKVIQQQIRHYLLAQQATVNMLASGSIVNFKTERMIDGDGDQPGMKRPDVVWVTTEGKQWGIEIELSAKWDRRLDEFVIGIAKAIKSEKFEKFFVVTDSPAIQKRYLTAIQPGADLPLWKKNNRAHWEIEKTTTVPSWLIERVQFILLGN